MLNGEVWAAELLLHPERHRASELAFLLREEIDLRGDEEEILGLSNTGVAGIGLDVLAIEAWRHPASVTITPGGAEQRGSTMHESHRVMVKVKRNERVCGTPK